MIARLLVACAAAAMAAPAGAAEMDPICADRPGLATGTCTVPAGMVQLETGLVEYARDRSGGIRTDELAIAATSVKFGLSDRLHVEISVPPFSRVRVRDGDSSERVSGFGDAALAFKYRLTGDGSAVAVALYPFVKIPTARRALGNGRVEGGVILPVEWAIPGSAVSMTLSPELGLAADGDGSGYHAVMAQAVSLSAPLSGRLGLALDLWGQWDWDPDGTARYYAIGPSLAYLVSSDVQLDAGVDFGLNRNSSDVTLYSGIAVRF